CSSPSRASSVSCWPAARSPWRLRYASPPSAGGARGTRTMAEPPRPSGPLQPARQAARIAEQDEADLVARAAAGDRAAFGTLVQRYAGVARRVAHAVLGNAEDADDAAQDAMLSALVKLEQYDRRRPFGPWLLRVVGNAATDRPGSAAVRSAEPLVPGFDDGHTLLATTGVQHT